MLQFARGLLAIIVLVDAFPWVHDPGVATARAAEGIAADMAPGAIGAPGRLQPGPRPESVLPHDVQPVSISGPPGSLLAIETAEGWLPLQSGPLRIGLVVGQPYRLRIGGIEGREGEELFPSLRIVAKLATPVGMDWRFPVEVAIDRDDIDAALGGSFVRRVVYLACEHEEPELVSGGWFDVRPGDNAFDVARTLGDPVAEVVIGDRLPAAGSLR
ncbi:MAG: hypothetical protein FJ284_12495 [Planctomycetes bacterium]|nr:hypothetical protein [Planctomycetota bacterium]